MVAYPLVIDIHVVKEVASHHWFIEPSGSLRIHHKEPESRDANEFIIKTLAETLGMPLSKITIINGVEQNIKRVKIGKDITKEQLIKALDAQKIL
jgi:uncharacterized protein YggU (UPF0235/DUF167 family)